MPAEWMSGIKAQLPKQNIKVVPAGAGVGVMRANYADSLHILLAVCVLVLLIACANIANLLLARGTARRAQTAVRLALGAIRKRLIRQSLTESMVLSVLGGAAGLAVAYLGVKAIVALAFHGAQYVPIDAAPSLPVLAFAFAAVAGDGGAVRNGAGVAGVACRAGGGAARREPHARGTVRRSRRRCWSIVQATLSVVLLAGAGLLTHSLQKLQHQDFGYETDHRVTISLTAPFSSYSQPKLDAMYRELQDRLAHIPGVERAALAQYTPLQDNWGEIVIRQGHGMPNMNEQNRLFVGPRESRVSGDAGRADSARALDHRAGHRDDAERRRGQRSVREEILQAGRRAAGHALRAGPAAVQQYLRDRRHRAQREVQRSWATPSRHVRCFLCRWRSGCTTTAGLMQTIDDSTHFIEGAVLQLHGSMEGLESEVRARAERRGS